MLIGCLYCGFCLYIIAWIDYNHAGNCSHERNILVTLVGGSILSYGNTCVCRTDFHIEMRISNRVSHLLKRTSCRKHCKRAGKRHLSRSSDSCSNAHHVALCDTTVYVTIRKFLFENGCLCGSRKVSIKNIYVIVLLCKLYKCVSIADTCGDFLYF